MSFRLPAFLLSCCALISATASAQDIAPWRLEPVADALRAASCNQADPAERFEPLSIAVTAAPLSETDPALPQDSPFRFAGGWEISSPDDNFGGLSGLSIEPDGSLLTVSDTGRFIRLGRTDGSLNGTAEIAPMRFENPLIRPGKLTSDAEGLTLADGFAFVSFEHDFRVLAFALESCGASARGIEISDPPSRYGFRPIRANAGPEALWMDGDGGLHVLYEQLRDGRVQTAKVTSDGKAHLSSLPLDPALEDGFRPVGADQIALNDEVTATAFLFRAYDRERGNRNRLDILRSDRDAPKSLFLAPPQQVDNFEGVALERVDDGLRVWVISDDNFSDRQKTLLYAFDVTP